MEPHLSLNQCMEGDNSQMELSSNMDEEDGGNGVGDHFKHKGKPYMAQNLGQTTKSLCFMAAATVLIFTIGYFIGYLVYRKKDCAPNCAASVPTSERPVEHETGAAPLMDWDDVKKLFAQKLSPAKFEPVLGEFSTANHRAGSPGDESLGNKVLNRFEEYGMNSWTDEHFVKVQGPPASGYNKFVFKNGSEERLDGFLSYSGNGAVKGAVLYAHYGEESDFRMLRDKNINMSGRVMLVRAGRISFAEKVHLGSGDPYTPGFPSFNHTQFPPVQSSGLPQILAQTITARMATNILRQLGGQNVPEGWGVVTKLGDETDVITVEVNNVLTEKKITNVFGVIKGFVDSDRYVVIGAQRDAWGSGFAASTVGTSVLVELARSMSDMVKNNGFKPRRSIVFASWSAGEYGSIGATEWLEGYLSSLSMKAFSYINLDGVVSGRNGFKVAASPLMYNLIEGALKEVNYTNQASLYSQFAKGNWEQNLLEPMKLDNAAYPFLAFSGIPSVSFRFTSNPEYPYFGTMLDTREKLNAATSNQVPQLAETATRFAGHMVLRLVHDHLLRMDTMNYGKIIQTQMTQINREINEIKKMQPQLLPTALTVQWLIMAYGSYRRASQTLATDMKNINLENIEMCRIINDRIMSAERNFLSPYVSPRESTFRHILLGSGPHTLKGLSNHLKALKTKSPEADTNLFHNQFALVTWTIQSCANTIAGDIWSFDTM
ncbi:Transferrin receptor protein 1 [Larimichthys crocea]|uniref:Transferrin receptor protein 1 n=1 Tax=Larimichthys crocea TaxID=215358 RepID=A0A6G0II76_LARCR|nr:Transferrin receptor protein 1 [Larimichthys crocea]